MPAAPLPPMPPGPPLWVDVRQELLDSSGREAATAGLLLRVVRCLDAGRGRLVLAAPGSDDDLRSFIQRKFGARLCELAAARGGEPYQIEWRRDEEAVHASA